jgi:hypothetical protein
MNHESNFLVFLTCKGHSAVMDYMKRRNLIIALPQHKKYRIEQLRKLAEVIAIGSRHHLRKSLISIICPPLLITKYSYSHRVFISGFTKRFAEDIVLTKPTRHSTFPEQIKADKDMHKIVCNQQLPELKWLTILH